MSVTDLSKELWEFRLQYSPEFSIFKGIIPATPQLDSLTVEAFNHRKDFCEKLLAKTKSIESATLTNKNDIVTLKLLQYYLNTVIEFSKYEMYLMPMNYYEGPDAYMQRYMLSKLPFKTEADYEYYMKIIQCFSKQLSAVQQMLDTGIKKGIVQHKVSLPAAVDRLRQTAESEPENTFFFKPFSNFPDGFAVELRNKLVQKGREVIIQYGQQSCKQLMQFLVEHYVPVLRDDPCVGNIPSVAGRYEAMLKYNCDTDMPPQELHNIGVKAVEENIRRMEKVLKKVGFSGTIQQFSEHLKTQKDQWFTSNDEVVEYCKNYIENVIQPKLDTYFNPLKRDHPLCVTVDSNVKSVAKALYINPSHDGTVPGSLVLDAHCAETMPKYEVPVLMLHEGTPGHHMQASHALEVPHLPEFLVHKDERAYYLNPANFPMNVAYMEGWSLYCEEMGEEMGLYENPLDEFGYLLHDSMRSCRVVVDTGIHGLGWSQDQAIQYMKAHTALSEVNIRNEVDRYITWPAQAPSYKLGHLRIRSLRQQCERELGAAFDLKEFHDLCLSQGQVPLDILEGLVEDYIQGKKRSGLN